MTKFDRYALSQYLLFFGLFALILVAVFWINRAVILFDRLIGDGQSAMVFLEFTVLALPRLIRMVLPMAAFASAVYVTNRFSGESELTVMRATGSSPWQLARPVLAFGAIVGLMMAVLTTVLLPASVTRLKEREVEVSRNVTARLLTEGAFLHPAQGVTFYISRISPDGTLNNVFLSDRREPGQNVIYTAERAFLVREGAGARLIMVDGKAQALDRARNTLLLTDFSDFSYDISSLIRGDEDGPRNIREIPTLELLTGLAAVMERDGYTAGQLTEELHVRFVRPLICVAVALLGFSTLMLGGFSRFGLWRHIVAAFGLLIVLETLRGTVSSPVIANPVLWPLLYLPPLLGLAISGLFLRLAGRPLRMPLRRRPAPPPEAPA